MERAELRTLSVLFENEPDALLRIIGLFSRRGITLDRLMLVEAEAETGLSRLTVYARLTREECGRVKERLLKIIQVLQVTE